jgi:hypothetical protein
MRTKLTGAGPIRYECLLAGDQLLVINATVCMQAVCIICIRFVASCAELCHGQIHRAANRWCKACHVQHSFNAMPTAYRTHSLLVVCLQDNLLGSI